MEVCILVLSEVIKKVRLELGLSQEALARELHVGFSAVNRWENNKTKPNRIARHVLIEFCKKNDIDSELVSYLESLK